MAKEMFAKQSSLRGDHIFQARGLKQKGMLNEREIQTLDLLCCYLRNKEIAGTLGVSMSLAEKLIRNAYTKVGASCRAEAILLWKAKRDLIVVSRHKLCQ
jgi:DNA-binding NarL/FixJ family response regulator